MVGQMTSRLSLPRHPLLPDLQCSRAVLVGCDDGVPRQHQWGPEKMATNLADALTAPDTAVAFRPTHTQVLLNPGHPDEILGAVRTAAAAATDTLLFYFVGRTSPHRRVPGEPQPGPNRAEDVVGSLGEVSKIIGDSEAVRSVVVLDGVGHRLFQEHTPTSFLLGGSSFGPPDGDQLCSFTPTLVSGLANGVRDGPEMLDLLTLRNAVDASFYEARYCIEDHWVVGPSRLTVHHPSRFRMVALGANPVFGEAGRHRTGGLLRNEDAVDQAYDW